MNKSGYIYLFYWLLYNYYLLMKIKKTQKFVELKQPFYQKDKMKR